MLEYPAYIERAAARWIETGTPGQERALARAIVRHVGRELASFGYDANEVDTLDLERDVARDLLQAKADALKAQQEAEQTDGLLARAAQIVRGAVAAARAKVTGFVQQALGLDRFRWVTKLDERVRPAHADLHGQVFAWRRGAPEEGRPGEPFGCRCSAEPVD